MDIYSLQIQKYVYVHINTCYTDTHTHMNILANFEVNVNFILAYFIFNKLTGNII